MDMAIQQVLRERTAKSIHWVARGTGAHSSANVNDVVTVKYNIVMVSELCWPSTKQKNKQNQL